MKKRFFVGSMLAAVFLPVGLVWAQSVDDKIQSLEQQLTQLKDQQIELKKDGTTQAAEMPSFSYRPGNGLNIEAADKSWSVRFTNETHFMYVFESGRDQVGRSQGEMMGRRFRPGVVYCVNNCLWQIEARLDLEGWGTGNGKNNTATLPGSMLQRGWVNFHGENLNPWLPMAQFGMDVPNAVGGSLARQGSSAIGAQADYDLHTRNNGFNTGRAGGGIVLNWDDKNLSSIGIPGRIGRLQLSMSSIGEGDDGTQSNTDRKDFNVYMSIQPFSQLKSKWLSGWTFEYGVWFCNADNRASQNGCDRYRVQDSGPGGRQTLFDTGAGSIGDGLHTGMGPGVVWTVGPYMLRAMGHFQQSEDRGGIAGKKRANSFLIAHDLFVWSPKGFLTGSAADAGSVLTGTHFERVDMSCGDHLRVCQGINGGEFHRSRVLLREWDLWYFIAPRMSLGVNILWYDASNLRSTVNQAAQNLSVCNKSIGDLNAGTCRSGIGGDWVDVFLNWRYIF